MGWTKETEPGTDDAGEWTDETAPDYDDADTWKSSLVPTSNPGASFLGVSEAPEDLHLDPEDVELEPENVQADNEDWTIEAEPD